MNRVKPNVGDIVLTVKIDRYHRGDNTTREETVSKVGRTYFYTDRNTAFEIYSFEHGAWRGKDSGYWYGHEFRAYKDRQAYEDEKIRRRMIKDLQGVDWDDAEMDIIAKVYGIIYGSAEETP